MGRPVRSGSQHSLPFGSSGSLGVSGFIGLRPGGRQVCSGSLGSLVCTVGDIGLFWVPGFIVVVGFLRGRRFRWGAPWSRGIRLGWMGFLRCDLEVVGFGWGRWVHWGAPLGTSDSLGVAGYIVVCPVCRPVRSVSLD